MKKGKKIWNRLLSLVLCLVTVTGMFAGMEMEAYAAETLPTVKFKDTEYVTYGQSDVQLIESITKGSRDTSSIKVHGPSDGNVFVNNGNWRDAATYKKTSLVGPSFSVKVEALFTTSMEVEEKDGWEGYSDSYGKSYTTSRTYKVKNYPYALPAFRVYDVYYNGTQTIEVPTEWTPDNAIANETYVNFSMKLYDSNGQEVPVTSTQKNQYHFSGDVGTYRVVLSCTGDASEWMSIDESGSIQNGWSKNGNTWSRETTFNVKKQKVKINYSYDHDKVIYETTVKAEDIVTVTLKGELDGKTLSHTLSDYFWRVKLQSSINAVDDPITISTTYAIQPCMQIALSENDAKNYELPGTATADNSYWADFLNVQKNTLRWVEKENALLTATYTGDSFTFDEQLIFKDVQGNASTNYKVQYENNEGKLFDQVSNAGVYNIIVSSTDPKAMYHVKYAGTGNAPQVQIAEADLSTANITLEQDSYTYDGKEKEPTVIVDLDGKKLEANKDYEVSYQNNKNAGTASVIVTGKGNYVGTTQKNFQIYVIPTDMVTVNLPESVIYNAQEQTPLVVMIDNHQLVADQDYTANYEKHVNVGTATVIVTSNNWSGEIVKTFEIIPKNLTVSIEGADEIYDGTKIAENANLVLTGVIENDEVSIDGDVSYKDANVGVNKTVTANNLRLVGGDASNYQLVDGDNQVINSTTSSGTITARAIEVTADSLSKIYGENDPTLTWQVTSKTKLVDGEELSGISITREVGENVTENGYIITVNQTEGSNNNYDITFVEGVFTIDEKNLTVEVKVLDKQYDGLVDAAYHTTLNGVVNGEDVLLDCSNVTAVFAKETVGESITVTLTGDFGLTGSANLDNYVLVQPQKEDAAAIYNTYDATEYIVTPDEWTNGSVSIIPQEGYCIATENKDSSEWQDKLEVSNETSKEGATITFYLRNDSTKAISLPETVTYFIDKTDPTGSIIIAENKFNTFLNTITFEIFFNKTQTVTIAAADDLSGIAKIEYYESAEGLTNEQIINLPADSWTEGDSVNVTLEDTKKFVYYARITDNAGNQICISSDGSVYDITYPVITGITNGETYYTTQVAEISDTNLDEVKLNGESLTITDGKIKPITLEGNEDATYKFVATDKAGNVTTVTVTMKTIASLSDQLADVTAENVTSDDAELIDEIQNIIADENQSNATEDEKELLKELLEKCDDLEESLEETKETVGNAIEVVDKVTGGSVTLNEESKLEEAKENLEKTLTNNKNNLTEDEKKAIQKTIDDLDAIIGVIEKVKEAVKAVGAAKSADGEYGVPDNEAAVSAYERAKSAYDRLTEEQKALLGSDVKKALEEVKTAITNYKVIEGDSKIWVYNTNGTLTFVGNGLVRKLKNVIVDGEVFSRENCHISKGSTVVEIEASALYWLGLGGHTFQLEYTDGKTDVAEFDIVTMEEWNAMMNQTGTNQTGTGAATGDGANILLWGAALAVGATGMVVAKKRRKDKEA